MEIKNERWGSIDGRFVQKVTVGDPEGPHIVLSSRGATLCEWHVPNAHHKLDNVVLCYDDLPSYEADRSYFGCTVGRVANRIAGAAFDLEGRRYICTPNEGGNLLHGGNLAFTQRVWETDIESDGVAFHLLSPDDDGGFPGEVKATVRYRFQYSRDGASLKISYAAEATALTPISLTNHAYFNLGGAGFGTHLDHTLQVAADGYTPVDSQLIPTGEIAPVEGTPFDLRTPKKLGSLVTSLPSGLDHNFALDPGAGVKASLHDPMSMRRLDVFTTEPGLQVYMGGFLDGSSRSRFGAYQRFGGICLETQRFPDFVHHKNFPGFFASPTNPYRSETTYVISVA